MGCQVLQTQVRQVLRDESDAERQRSNLTSNATSIAWDTPEYRIVNEE